MPSFWNHVKKVIEQSDIVIEVLDARQITQTRNGEVEQKVLRAGKKLLFVVSKCDLVNVNELKKKMRDLKPSVFISATDHYGTTILKKKILELSRGEHTTVGVVGYPNVGKSSLINALSGRGAARTSSESGFTKGMQRIKVDNKIVVLDTPGVYPNKEKDEAKHGKIGAIDYSKVKDPEMVAIKLIEEYEDLIRSFYDVGGQDASEILENIALAKKRLLKGGEPDLETTGRLVLKDWQTGKIKDV